MRVLAFLLISVVVTLNVIVVEAAKGKSTVAVPRKAKGNPISRSVFGSMFTRAFREMKVTFCSELEALTLQVILLHFSAIVICKDRTQLSNERNVTTQIMLLYQYAHWPIILL